MLTPSKVYVFLPMVNIQRSSAHFIARHSKLDVVGTDFNISVAEVNALVCSTCFNNALIHAVEHGFGSVNLNVFFRGTQQGSIRNIFEFNAAIRVVFKDACADSWNARDGSRNQCCSGVAILCGNNVLRKLPRVVSKTTWVPLGTS